MSNTNKIEPLAEMSLLSEIVLQSKIAESAFNQLSKSSDHIGYWVAIQSFLISTSNISKILWPSKKYKDRGKQLRKLLKINNSNLLKDRSARNYFEHYDERIQSWFENNKTSVYKDLVINPFEPPPWSFKKFSHREYNPTSKVLTLRNESINLGQMMDAVFEIRDKCKPFVLT